MLVELRRGNGQGYHYRCREDGPPCHVEYYNGGDAWVPFENTAWVLILRTGRLWSERTLMSREAGLTTTHRPDGLCSEGVSPRLLCNFGCNCRAKLNCLRVRIHKP